MEEKLREYARLLVEVGLNVDKGQDLVINCPVECAWFARMCADAAYDVGCREVILRWRDDYLDRQKYLRAADDVFDAVPAWQVEFLTDYARKGSAYLAISASDPENMKGVDQDRMIRLSKASNAALKEYQDLQMSNGFPWCVASVPIPSWARRVFPDVSESEAMNKLWDAIFHTLRISGSGDAVARWQEHLDTLQKRVDTLNGLHLESLHYTNSLGTDLKLRLPEDHLWVGGGGNSKAGRYFVANMPTEEIFSAPMKDGVDGHIYASLPLVHNGTVIEGIHFVVKDGRIVEAHASAGEEALKAAISLDEGASRFGEVALVPYASPISDLKILFYNTLFDENASCHLAFGKAYPECVKGGEDMTDEELAAKGLNDSMTHVDFMLGTKDLSIVGHTRDGRDVPIFVDGNFAI